MGQHAEAAAAQNRGRERERRRRRDALIPAGDPVRVV